MIKDLLIIFAYSVLILSCKNKENNIDYYVLEIKKQLSSSQIQSFKSKEKGDLINYLRYEFRIKSSENLIKLDGEKLNQLFITNGITENIGDAVFLALHYKLNKQKIDYNKIKVIIEDYYKKEMEEEEMYLKGESETAKKNFNKFNDGEVICLNLPIIKTPKGKDVKIDGEFYLPNGDWRDTLKLKGILLEKNANYFPDSINTYFFQIKILDLSDESPAINKKLKVNSSFELYLNSYKHPIIKGE